MMLRVLGRLAVGWLVFVGATICWLRSPRGTDTGSRPPTPPVRTIVAYSERMLEEMERAQPITCSELPAEPTINLINRTWSWDSPWQGGWQRVAGSRVALYAAYYDLRSTQHYVRLLASFKGGKFPSSQPLFCQTRGLQGDEAPVSVVAARGREVWWGEWDPSPATTPHTPLLLSCPLPTPLPAPALLSIVARPCDSPTNALLVHLPRNISKRNFTICLKDLNFHTDISRTLIEWIEANRLLGVDLIDVYVDKITKPVARVLEYYRDEGYVRLFHVPVRSDPSRGLWQRRRDHLITYNDCLYRNIAESEYIIPLDMDEIILPKIAPTLPKLLKRLEQYGWSPEEYSAVMIRNVFFFDTIQNKTIAEKVVKESKIYTKRDDVRIDKNESLEENFVELDHMKKIYVEDNLIELEKRCDLVESKLSKHVVRASSASPAGRYSKSLMVAAKVLAAFNHYPLASRGVGVGAWPAPLQEVQLNHYKAHCDPTMVPECATYERRTRIDTSALPLAKLLRRAVAKAVCAIGDVT